MTITNEAVEAAAIALNWHNTRCAVPTAHYFDEARAALEAAAPFMLVDVTDEAFGYAVSAIRGHGEFTTAEAEAAVHDIISALRPTP